MATKQERSREEQRRQRVTEMRRKQKGRDRRRRLTYRCRGAAVLVLAGGVTAVIVAIRPATVDLSAVQTLRETRNHVTTPVTYP